MYQSITNQAEPLTIQVNQKKHLAAYFRDYISNT